MQEKKTAPPRYIPTLDEVTKAINAVNHELNSQAIGAGCARLHPERVKASADFRALFTRRAR